MADDNNTDKKPIISEDLLFEGDIDKINQAAEEAVKAAVAEAMKKKEAAGGQTPKDDDPLTPEQISAIKPEDLDWAVFKDDDEDIRETAAAMLEKELKKLPEGATRKDVNAAAEKVSKRLSKVIAKQDAGQQGDGNNHDPLPMHTSGAAAAHVNDKRPATNDEAEEYANKLAAGFKLKD